jgi:hypothetical protein
MCIEVNLLSVKVMDGSLRSHKISVLSLQLRFVARTFEPVRLNRNSLEEKVKHKISRNEKNACL